MNHALLEKKIEDDENASGPNLNDDEDAIDMGDKSSRQDATDDGKETNQLLNPVAEKKGGATARSGKKSTARSKGGKSARSKGKKGKKKAAEK